MNKMSFLLMTILTLLSTVHSLNFEPLFPGLERFIIAPFLFTGLLRARDVPMGANQTGDVYVGVANIYTASSGSNLHHVVMVINVDGELVFEVLRFPGYILADLDVVDNQFLNGLGIDYDYKPTGPGFYNGNDDYFPFQFSINLANKLKYEYDSEANEHVFEWVGRFLNPFQYPGVNASYSLVTKISDDISTGVHVKFDANFFQLDNRVDVFGFTVGLQSNRLTFILPMNYFTASLTRLDNGGENKFKFLVKGNRFFLGWDTGFTHKEKNGTAVAANFDIITNSTQAMAPESVIHSINEFLNKTELRAIADIEISYGTFFFIANRTNADEIHWDPSMGMLYGVDEDDTEPINEDDITLMITVVVVIAITVAVLLAVLFVGVINRKVLPQRDAARKHNMAKH